ncbi:DUF3575 domain-containing protein [Polaribacter batillariae]|uniref:DUF3575 domain-containing protein n=1 Tax=Polaribacter batillariae TaxID=2808900 RepID=A0ABX7SVQ8_9FLAO|nr:DUF3575 domain-containing protein [Polaribacter batillariae]QTD37413.1 DUF3575 domain-containing protein [Polaribacter batillariae]
MKKILLFAVLILSIQSYAQETKNKNLGKNEFKVNLAFLIAGYPEITYERLLSNETSFGITMGFSIDNSTNSENNTNYNFSLLPYYRIYFGNKPNAGFFIDGNLALYSQKQRHGDFFSEDKKGGTGFGFGFGIGKKYKTKKGWVGEFSFGLTRTLINKDKINLLYPRFGITVGKIF